ncbi:MAG TPA: hypothetical protein VNO30_07460 [Kofleriaceae bacterium]|nr:hypothetical protein [Kofleriaceae bacterium]
MAHPERMHRALGLPLLATSLTAALAALAPTAAAEPAWKPERAVIVGRVAGGAWSDGATEARADQQAELAVVVVGRRGRQPVVLAPEGVERVRIAGVVRATERMDAQRARVQWSTVEPHGFRARPATTGVTSSYYSNVSVEPKTFGTWLGFDHIDYFERVVAAWGAPATIPAAVTSGEPNAQQVPGLGTVRYKVELELDGARLQTPGAEAADTFGVLPSVHRVSIRRGDDFLGHLSAYLLVPEVFGSAGEGRNHQTDRFTGADCADVMVGAMRRMGRPLPYSNVAGLTAFATMIVRSTDIDEHGAPAQPITGVREGDLIRIDYGGALRGHTPRAFDHVAALWEDRSDPSGPHKGGPDGQLDGFDLVIHMGHPRLVIEPLTQQSPATIDVLRWKK